MRQSHWLILFFWLTGQTAQAQRQSDPKPWHDSQWLRVYQYQKTSNGKYLSDIQSKEFFFSEQGQSSPEEEYKAALKAFTSEPESTNQYGIQKASASCVFPARKKIISKLSGKHLPYVSCPELENWIGRLNAEKLSLVFAGAYPGNPASVLGHTFLLFHKKSSIDYKGRKLLSYTVGFAAAPDPRDSKISYMLKGITGGYPGFYEIDPFYIKTGIYNNSESRDLWEWPLDISTDQVDFLLHHLWELTFNARFRYYFFDENCSYRIFTYLDTVMGNPSLSQQLPFIVIPGETVRTAQDHGLLGNPEFSSSISRRISFQTDHMSSEELNDFKSGQSDLKKVTKISNPLVLNGLIDHWLYENYKATTKLPKYEREIMEQTLIQRSKISRPSPLKMDDEKIRSYYQLQPITSGHRPRLLRIGIKERPAKAIVSSFRFGYHPLWAGGRAYDNIAEIEYLGLDIEQPIDTNEAMPPTLWSAALIEVTNLTPFSFSDMNPSWSFDAKVANHCSTCGVTENDIHLEIKGGAGASLLKRWGGLYLLPHLRGYFWTPINRHKTYTLGATIGGYSQFGLIRLTTEMEQNFQGKLSFFLATTYIKFKIEEDLSGLFTFQYEDGSEPANHQTSSQFSLAYFF